jgi:type VI secretion system secreted protein VgrG
MADISSPLFRFSSLALPTDAFSVVDFKGNEGLSTLFEFEINLVSSRSDIDLDAVLAAPACFRFMHGEEETPVHGTLKELHLLHCEGGYAFYHAKLAPKLWLLTLTQQNQVFLDKSLPQILEELLLDGGLSANDFEFRLSRKYAPWEYVCQFRESHYNFFARWLEREGAYYFFEHTKLGAKCVITDNKNAHRPTPLSDLLRFGAACESEATENPEELRSFVCRQRKVSGSVRLRDENYLLPSSELSGDAPVSETGSGAVYYYGENFRTPSEANALAKIRAEELKCLEKRFYGQSRAPFLRPGFTFRVEGTAPPSLNRGYLLTQLVHRGGQTEALDPAIQAHLPKREPKNFYANNFCAIADELQFRPERLTVKPRFFGAVTARLDAAPAPDGVGGAGEEGSDEQTMDALGRYKVILPFDESGRAAGKASGWVRRMTIYAGRGYGARFPLRKGAEVVLGFLDGDPDRPYISGVMPVLEGQVSSDSTNPPHVPLSHDPGDPADLNAAALVTAGGNALRFYDAPGQESVLLASPRANARLLLGGEPGRPTPTDDPNAPSDEPGAFLGTDADVRVEARNLRTRLSGDSALTVGADRREISQGRSQDFALGGRAEFNGAPSWELSAEVTRIATEERVLAEARFEAVAERRSAVGQQSEIVSSHSSIRAETLEAAGACSLVRASRNEICGAATLNAGSELLVVERRVAAVGDEVTTARTRQESAGVLQREIGQLVERVETASQRAGALLRSARLAVDTAELHCDRSDVIMHG